MECGCSTSFEYKKGESLDMMAFPSMCDEHKKQALEKELEKLEARHGELRSRLALLCSKSDQEK